ncbi:hypothetical protein [Crocosphaera sp.]|uniref:helix-turn-helix domain-containing transcriptional regulator n=1 Tax=Crocosphaera sp. TaxID=2729996 RepID=UPI00260C608A|nr:hypothetical protein [Crocosphaera sp.]MDJ0579955.1 hypothetical protein [Crocosphaera sp.]
MRKYRTFDQVEEEYYRQHPEEIESFLTVIFEEYAKNNDTGALLSALRMISRVKGVTATAEAAGISRKGLQKAFPNQLSAPINIIWKDINLHFLAVFVDVNDNIQFFEMGMDL